MKTSEKIAKIAKFTATAATKTATNCSLYVAAASPVAVAATCILNKITTGSCNAKTAAVSVAKDAVMAVAVVTAANTAIAAVAATSAAVRGTGMFAETEEDPSVEEFDDWDEDEEEE
jgi:hypothetical protein